MAQLFILYNCTIGIIVPTLLIVLSTIDFFKVMISQKMDELPEVKKRFIRRLIAGAIIFFIPKIVIFIFSGLVN